MSKNSNLLAGIILGAAAGVAMTRFVQSERGRRLTAQAKSMALDLKDATTEVVQNELNNIVDKSKAISKQATALVEDISTSTKKRVKKAKQTANGSS